MKYYVRAYGLKDNLILGNLDGQAVLRTVNWQRTKHCQKLKSGIDRPAYPRVAYWQIEDDHENVITRIYNTGRKD